MVTGLRLDAVPVRDTVEHARMKMNWSQVPQSVTCRPAGRDRLRSYALGLICSRESSYQIRLRCKRGRRWRKNLLRMQVVRNTEPKNDTQCAPQSISHFCFLKCQEFISGKD